MEKESEAWDRFKDLLRACPHYGFSDVHQLDTFYNALNSKDQDSLNFTVGGNFLDKMPRECLSIIESKSKVRYSHNQPVVAKVSTNTSTSGISPDVAELKDMVKALLLDKKSQNQAPATMKAAEESCLTCGGADSYRNCPATDGNVYRDNIQEFVSQAFAVNYNQGNTIYRPPMMSNQIRPPSFPLEVLGFSDVIASGNPTPYYDLIISTTSLTLTPFGNSDFLLEEVDAFLAIEDDPTSLKVELKDLPPHLEYAFLEGDDKLPVIIVKDLSEEEKTTLITVLKSHERAIAWKLSDIKGIDPEFCTHKILMEKDFEPTVQHQRIVNPKIHDVIKQEVLKFLDAGLIYPIYDSPWVSPIHCVPKKGGFTVVENEDNELILTHLVTRWRVCIDYRKLNEATRKDHFPLPRKPHSPAHTERLLIAACLLGYYAPGTFQRCMMVIVHDMIEKTMEVFMDDFSVFRNSFQSCLSHLERMLKRCEDTNLFLNWEKRHFMVKEGIVLGHKICKQGIEVDKAKVDVITKLPHPTTVKGIRSFLGHADFYLRFIKYFSKIARPMTRLLEKDTPFHFSKECVEAFQTLKINLTEAPILIAPD
nr:retrovirus-related Pol polyprotein from transposon 17.6 [Tanacetum cinerariifolium]